MKKNQIPRKILIKKCMENYFATLFEDVRDERSSILLLPLTDPENLEQSKFIDHKSKISLKN